MLETKNPAAEATANGVDASGGMLGVDYSTRLAEALELADLGVPVFPVRITTPDENGKRAKIPTTSHGLNDATTDADTIRQWWNRNPRAAIGVPTGKVSGIDALDVDPEGETWAADNTEVLMNAGRIHHTERGKHYLYQHFEGCRNSSGKIAPGIDVRGEGGFIVWWPAEGRESFGELEEIGPAPDTLKTTILGAQGSTKSTTTDAKPGSIIDGQRNDTLAREAGWMRHHGYSGEAIDAALQVMNRDRCAPALDAAEVSKIAYGMERYDPTADAFDAPDPVAPFDMDAARVGELLDREPPEREWLVTDRVPLGVVGLLAAAGGTGKSMATLQLAVSVCTGVPWLQMPMGEPGPVLIFSAEDDRDEVHRRLSRVVGMYRDNVTGYGLLDHDAWNEHDESIRRRLFVFDRVGENNQLTRKVHGTTERTEFAERVIRTAHQAPEAPRLIVLDPLSRFDGGEPNDNADGTRLVEAAEQIRKQTGATVLLPHHVAKASMKDSEAGQEAVRGASGLVDGARWVGLLQTMGSDTAKHYGIEETEAGRYVRFSTPKANYSAPWGALWLERQAGGVMVPAELKPTKATNRERKADAEYHELMRRIAKLIEDKGPMPKRRIADDWGGTTNTLKAGQKKVRDTIQRAIEEGHLVNRVEDGANLVGLPETAPQEAAA